MPSTRIALTKWLTEATAHGARPDGISQFAPPQCGDAFAWLKEQTDRLKTNRL